MKISLKKFEVYILCSILLIASLIRIINLNKVPVSLFGDEVDVGYQAYSILKTGRDYYGNLLPIHFHSLAEWRTPLFLYSAVPFVAIFGVSPWGVRLPAAIFGILGIFVFYLFVKSVRQKYLGIDGPFLELMSTFLLAISPWHIQYSRAGFEVTLLLFLLILGVYFFFKSLGDSGKSFWLSTLMFALTPWVYSTAKLFTPFLILYLFIAFRKDILSFSRKYIIVAVATLLIVSGPIAINTVFGGGAQRFGYISIFSDPTTSPEVGNARLTDARMRGEKGEGIEPKLTDRLFHNKYTFWGEKIITNYLKSFSTDFLFIKGDPNPRHSIGIGEFYRIEAITLILGIVFFFTGKANKKFKNFILFWLLFTPLPAAITRDGGNHATRLILMLPPLIFLVAYGIVRIIEKLGGIKKTLFIVAYFSILGVSFIFYQHNYWVHYPWHSERWWHAGFKETFDTVKAVEKNYDKIVISTANEPPWIFFAGLYEFPPLKWQKEFPITHKVDLPGFGKVSYIDKFYFASPQDLGFYDWNRVIEKGMLYVASATEVNVNLIREPGRITPGLTLIKAVAYPSGEPAYYLFTAQQ